MTITTLKNLFLTLNLDDKEVFVIDVAKRYINNECHKPGVTPEGHFLEFLINQREAYKLPEWQVTKPLRGFRVKHSLVYNAFCAFFPDVFAIALLTAIASQALRIENRGKFAAMVNRISTIRNLSATQPKKADDEFVMLQPRLAQFSSSIIAISLVVKELKIYANEHGLEAFLSDWKNVSELLYAKFGSKH